MVKKWKSSSRRGETLSDDLSGRPQIVPKSSSENSSQNKAIFWWKLLKLAQNGVPGGSPKWRLEGSWITFFATEHPLRYQMSPFSWKLSPQASKGLQKGAPRHQNVDSGTPKSCTKSKKCEHSVLFLDVSKCSIFGSGYFRPGWFTLTWGAFLYALYTYFVVCSSYDGVCTYAF